MAQPDAPAQEIPYRREDFEEYNADFLVNLTIPMVVSTIVAIMTKSTIHAWVNALLSLCLTANVNYVVDFSDVKLMSYFPLAMLCLNYYLKLRQPGGWV